MCGIVGILDISGREVTEHSLKTFTNSLNHRGPDSNGIYISNDRTLGLGHTRTSIFDTSSLGSQPMSYNDRYWITFNGEIYNFIELRKELSLKGYNFKSNTDTEVILASYIHWGDKCQFKFNGDWAFAIWDAKEKKLFISCDRFGSKPLYYIHLNNYFIFSSELKAFMKLPINLRPEFDYSYLAHLGKNHGTINTFLNKASLCSGGHQINLNNKNQLQLKKWWKTNDNLIEIPKTYEGQTEHFKEILLNACKIRLRSDVPISSCLSGGLDSSSIVSLNSKIYKEFKNIERSHNLKQSVFVCDFEDNQDSEISYAKKAINNKNISPNYIILDKNSVTPEKLIKVQFDHEWIDADSFQLSILYEKMRELGIRVSVDGNAPDELLGGYWEDPEVSLLESWPLFARKRFKDLASIRKDITGYDEKNLKLKISIKKLISQKNYNRLSKLFKHNLIKNENYFFIEKSNNLYAEFDKTNNLDYFSSYLYNQFHYISTPHILQKYDKLSMAHGILSRSPFLDPNLVTYIFSLPSTSKIGNGFTKRILRDSMKSIVPEDILLRKKKIGFSAPKNWYDKAFKTFISDTLSSNSFLNSDIWNGKKIKNHYENNKLESKKVLRFVQIMHLINSFNEYALKK